MNKWRLLYTPILSSVIALLIYVLQYGYHGGSGQELNNITYTAIGLTSLVLGIANTLLETNPWVVGISAAIFGYLFLPSALITAALSGYASNLDDPALYPLSNSEWARILFLGGAVAIIPCLLPAIVIRIIRVLDAKARKQ